MTTKATINLLVLTLMAGMQTGYTENDDFYVKTFYIGDPLGLYQIMAPAAAIIPAEPKSRISQYIGEDTITETYVVRFYQPAYRTADDEAETSAGLTRLMAMLDKAEALLRADPTFGSQFVNSEIRNVIPSVPTAGDGNAYRIAGLSIEIKRRALWGA